MSSQRLPLFYQYQMDSLEALKLVRRYWETPREDARLMRNLLLHDQPIPERLHPLCEKMFLVNAMPWSNRLH